MNTLHRAMPVFMRNSLHTMFAYRGELVLWAIWGVVYPAVAMVMWQVAARDPIAGDDIGGFGPRDFAAYFLMTMVVGHLCTAWDLYEMGYQVRTGRMSPKLLLPILPVWERIADNIAYKVLTLVILIPIWAVVAVWAEPRFQTQAVDLLIGLPATLLAAALFFLWGYNLAMAAFWMTRTDGLGELWFGASMFFGGRLAPLEILPEPMQWVAAVLPFKWMIWFPSAVLMGRQTPESAVWGMLAQAGWLIAGLIVFRRLWSAGLRRYSAVGA